MNEETRNKIVKLVLEQLKKEYIHGDNGPDTFDCAGLVWHVYNKVLGINVYKDGYGLSTTGRIMTNPIGTITYFDEDEKFDSNVHDYILNTLAPAINECEGIKYMGHQEMGSSMKIYIAIFATLVAILCS